MEYEEFKQAESEMLRSQVAGKIHSRPDKEELPSQYFQPGI